MRFVLINRFFWPDESATSLLLTDLAEDLAKRGHEVVVLTSRQLYNHPGANLLSFEDWQGIQIRRLFSTSFGRDTLTGRVIDIVTFRWSVVAEKKRLFPPDVWFVMTDPPLILEQILKLRKILGGRIVHHVNDVYPDLAHVLGVLPMDGLVTKWLYHRSHKAFLKCDRALALGECMAEVLRKKGIPDERISVTPPWADERKLRPLNHSENSFRKELGLSESDFVVMYSGNMGKGHRFEAILEAARVLDKEERIHFVFIGDGAKRHEVQAFYKRYELKRFHLLPYQPRERLRETLSAGDIHLISLDSRVQGLIVPSKLAGILAVGRPVVFIGGKENSVAQTIIHAGCGSVMGENDGMGLVKAIEKLFEDNELRKLLGDNSRKEFVARFSREIVVPKIISILEGTS